MVDGETTEISDSRVFEIDGPGFSDLEERIREEVNGRTIGDGNMRARARAEAMRGKSSVSFPWPVAFFTGRRRVRH